MLQYVMAQLEAHRSEEGQGLVEYALIIFFVALVCIAAVTLLGTNVSAILNNIANALGGA